MGTPGGSGRPEAPRASWWDRAWQPFWVLPAVIAAGSLLLGLTLPAVDQAMGEPWAWVFQGGVDGARSVLGAIAGAMISVTGLVFSITMVVLQLASSQYSPRVLANFLDSRISQITLGVFTGSFIYALTVLRQVGGTDDRVPQLSVTAGYLYVLVAVGMFLAFIHHITGSVQVSRVMSDIRVQALALMDQVFPEGDGPLSTWSPRPATPRVDLVAPGRGGYVTVLDSTGLVQRAATLEVVVELTVAPGDYLAEGQPVGRAWGREELSADEAAGLVGAIHCGTARTLHGDIALGVRQLLDIAERALSPGINDPTTALQAMNELHSVLRQWCQRPDLSAFLSDEEGIVRAVYRPPTYARALAATVEELVHYGRDTLRVVPHLSDILEDLAAAARPEHRPTTEAALQQVKAFWAQRSLPEVDLEVREKSPENP